MTAPSNEAIAQAFRDATCNFEAMSPLLGYIYDRACEIDDRARELDAAKPEQIHTCSYDCDRPACIKAQRDELRDRLEGLDAAKGGACERCGKTRAGTWTAGHPLAFCTCAHYATPPAQAAEAVDAVAWRSKNFDPLMSGGFAWSFTTDPGSVTARHEGLYVNVAADAIAAARYRWLRDYAGIIEESGPLVFHADKDARPGTPIDGRLLDAAIDAAIAAMQAKP